MYCYLCVQTAKGTVGTAVVVCGLSPEISDLQDLLIHISKGVSMYAHKARELDAIDPDIDLFVVKALFTTITNVNFDEERMETMLKEASRMKEKAKLLYEKACGKSGKNPENLGGPAAYAHPDNRDDMIRDGEKVTPESWSQTHGEVVQGL